MSRQIRIVHRVIARHSFGAHHVEVAEVLDDDGERLQLLIDGDVLPPDDIPRHPLSRSEAARLLDDWLADHPSPHDPPRQHVAAIFDDRESATRALEGLRALGVDDGHIGLALNEGERIVFEHDDEAGWGHRIVEGLAIGAPIGAIAGIAVASVVLPGVAVGGLAAFGGAGTLWGLLAGGYAATTDEARRWDRHEEFRSLRLAPGEVLVVVMGHGHTHRVEQSLADAGGRIVRLDTEPSPVEARTQRDSSGERMRGEVTQGLQM